MENQKIITAIRHAPSSHNAKKIIAGRKDVPLSDDGRSFAREFIQERGAMSADKIYSSPLQRSVETASILFDIPIDKLNLEPLCIERSYGEMEGASCIEIESMDITYKHVGGIAHSLNPPGGETLEKVKERANQFLSLLLKDPAKEIAFVSHQTFLKQFFGLLQGLSVHDSLGIEIYPMSVNCFTFINSKVVEQTKIFEGAVYIKSW